MGLLQRPPVAEGEPIPRTLTWINIAYGLSASVLYRLEEVPMRTLALMILTMGMALAAGHARAQRYDPAFPVCLYVVPGRRRLYNCSYYTMDQCRTSANGRCSLNPITLVQRRRRDGTIGVIMAKSDQDRPPAETRSYAPPGAPFHYRAAPYHIYNELYYGASRATRLAKNNDF
jgi:hypothetical protein